GARTRLTHGGRSSRGPVAPSVTCLTMSAMVRLPLAWICRAFSRLSVDFEDRFDLDRYAQRQFEDSDRPASMAAGLAERAPEDLARSVDHRGLAGEAVGRRDEADDLHDAYDMIQTDQCVDRGQDVECASRRQLLGLLRGDLPADLAGGEHL